MTNAVGNGVERRMFLPEKDRVLAEVGEAAARFCDLLVRFDTLDVPAVGSWTAQDVAAHLVSAVEVYTRIVLGEPSPCDKTYDEVPGISEAFLREVAESDPPALAGRLAAGAAAFLAAAETIPEDADIAFHFGQSVPVSCPAGLLLGELVIHGYDLARARGEQWPVPDRWAHTILRSATPMLPILFDEQASVGVRTTYDIRMRGEGGPRIVLRIADGTLTVHEPGTAGRVDCSMSADPFTLLLVFYGRLGPLPAAFTGKALAWGRRPWRGLTLTRYFRNP